IISQVCRCIANFQGNIGKTRMTRVGGDFAIMAVVHMEEENLTDLEGCLQDSFPDFIIGLRKTTVDAWSPFTGQTLLTMKLIGPDDLGLLESLAAYAADRNYQIVALESSNCPGSHVGYDIFEATMSLVIPRSHSIDSVAADAKKMAEKLGVDIRVTKHMRRSVSPQGPDAAPVFMLVSFDLFNGILLCPSIHVCRLYMLRNATRGEPRLMPSKTSCFPKSATRINTVSLLSGISSLYVLMAAGTSHSITRSIAVISSLLSLILTVWYNEAWMAQTSRRQEMDAFIPLVSKYYSTEVLEAIETLERNNLHHQPNPQVWYQELLQQPGTPEPLRQAERSKGKWFATRRAQDWSHNSSGVVTATIQSLSGWESEYAEAVSQSVMTSMASVVGNAGESGTGSLESEAQLGRTVGESMCLATLLTMVKVWTC
ncbi:hypothetical protein FOL47_010844, partial [Perkinsus chesapeaki]